MKELYTYSDFQKTVTYLQDYLLKNNFTSITSIYRGSIPLGVKLSNLTNLPLNIIEFQSRDGYNKEPKWCIKKDINKTLVIDDIYDSGFTIKKIKEFLDKENINYEIFTIYCKINKKDEARQLGIKFEKLTNNWIIFEPWE